MQAQKRVPTDGPLGQDHINLKKKSLFFIREYTNFYLVTAVIFLDVSQNFNNISQENEAVVWDVDGVEKLLRVVSGKLFLSFKPLTPSETSDSWRVGERERERC